MIKLQSVSLSFGERPLFNNLSFSLGGRHYGLVGQNGAGKSTLARLICQLQRPDSGSVISDVHPFYFAQFEPQNETILSEYLNQIWISSGYYQEIISSLMRPLDLSRRLDQLSGGEWMRARLVRALADAPDFFVLDEPSNNLDREGKAVLLDFLNQYQGGLLLISHDRELLERAEFILELTQLGIRSFGGNFSFYKEASEAERNNHELCLEAAKRHLRLSEVQNQQSQEQQVKRMKAGARRARTEGLSRIEIGYKKRQAQATMGKVAKDRGGQVDEAKAHVQELSKKTHFAPFLRLDFEGAEPHSGKILLNLDEFNLRFHGTSNTLWREPISLKIQGPQRWHLKGKNGSGKSSLVKWIAGMTSSFKQSSGEAKVYTPHLAYLDQSYSLLSCKETVLQNLQQQTNLSETDLRNELAFYGFTGEKVFQKVETLSGGEKLKLSLALLFLSRIPELLILDEPTNNLDLHSLEILEEALSAFRGALVLISHDEEFVKSVGVTDSLELTRNEALGT